MIHNNTNVYNLMQNNSALKDFQQKVVKNISAELVFVGYHGKIQILIDGFLVLIYRVCPSLWSNGCV